MILNTGTFSYSFATNEYSRTAGDEEVEVIVRLPEAHRTSIPDIRDMRLVTAAGQVVPLSEVARIEERTGPLIIRRHDRERRQAIEVDELDLIGEIDAWRRAFPPGSGSEWPRIVPPSVLKAATWWRTSGWMEPGSAASTSRTSKSATPG